MTDEEILLIVGEECEHQIYCQDADCKLNGQVVCRVDIGKVKKIREAMEKEVMDFKEWMDACCSQIGDEPFWFIPDDGPVVYDYQELFNQFQSSNR